MVYDPVIAGALGAAWGGSMVTPGPISHLSSRMNAQFTQSGLFGQALQFPAPWGLDYQDPGFGFVTTGISLLWYV